MRRIVKGVLTRYVPACAATVAGVYAFVFSSPYESYQLATIVLVMAAAVACSGLVFGIVLAVLRRRLDTAAPVDGRPSVVAGFVSPFAFWLAVYFTPAPTLIQGLLLAGASGGFVAFAMFFPWLSHRERPKVM